MCGQPDDPTQHDRHLAEPRDASREDLRDAICIRGTCRGCRRTVNLAAHDCPEPARAEHARRTAGRPRRVVYTEPEDVDPPDPPEPVNGCACHDELVCPDYFAALYEADGTPPYPEDWP